jgi:hypothetical protein
VKRGRMTFIAWMMALKARPKKPNGSRPLLLQPDTRARTAKRAHSRRNGTYRLAHRVGPCGRRSIACAPSRSNSVQGVRITKVCVMRNEHRNVAGPADRPKLFALRRFAVTGRKGDGAPRSARLTQGFKPPERFCHVR